jgi:hypothetical protein
MTAPFAVDLRVLRFPLLGEEIRIRLLLRRTTTPFPDKFQDQQLYR